MTDYTIHFVHVGNMSNKGTQALFKSDVRAIGSICREVSISVSTIDIEGVRKLDLPLDSVLPPAVDIPYERADQLIRKFGGKRGSMRYKGFTIAFLLYMFIQILLTMSSIFLVKVGLKAFYRAEVMNRVKNSDLVISHSDENFKESASLLPLNPYWIITWWSMLISRTCEILVAKSFGKPVVMFPNSVGPFRTWIGRCLSRLSLNHCDYVLIRDSISYEIVNRLAIRAFKILTFDTALLFNTPNKNVLSDFHRPLIGVSPGIYSHSLSRGEVENYISAHAKSLDIAIEKYGFVAVFLPHYVSGFSYDDLDVCNLIIHKMRNKNQVRIINTTTVEDFKAYLDQMDIILSSKMHPAVLGASGYVPILCVAYDHKQTSFFERLGMADCTLDIRLISPDRLSSKIDQVWNRANLLTALLKDRIPRWQEDVKEAIRSTVAHYIGMK